MKYYTGFEYLLIDAANNFMGDLDKDLFEDRIAWGLTHLKDLEKLATDRTWKTKPLYLKAVQAIRKAQRGEPTGHRVGLDAICSGMQIMSAVTGCEAGAAATGLINTGERPDAYTKVTDAMRRLLGHLQAVVRDDAKDATMKTLYGSKAEPKAIFGEGTPELNAFYEGLYEVAPGACELLQTLLDAWNPYALVHDWELPDGFLARVKVMETVEKRIEVDELDHASFTYRYKENVGTETGLSLAANVIHSIDAYILRCLVRRCNYNRMVMMWAAKEIEVILLERAMNLPEGYEQDIYCHEEFLRLRQRYEATQMPDIRILDYAQHREIRAMSSEHLRALAQIVNGMLAYKPFPILSVHDDFSAHPNNLNHVRQQYANILAELAESTVLDDILNRLYGAQGSFQKHSPDLGKAIRQAEYPLS